MMNTVGYDNDVTWSHSVRRRSGMGVGAYRRSRDIKRLFEPSSNCLIAESTDATTQDLASSNGTVNR